MIRAVVAAAVLGYAAMTFAAQAADPTYPFEGSWIRSDRSCAASPSRERVYTARDVVSTRGRCTIRKVAAGSGGFELFERCDRSNERPGAISEIIRMTSPDSMTLNRQTARLKLSRSLHFIRCRIPPGSKSQLNMSAAAGRRGAGRRAR